MKVKEPQMIRALDNPDGKVRLYLLYGPDDAGSRALATRLERVGIESAERGSTGAKFQAVTLRSAARCPVQRL